MLNSEFDIRPVLRGLVNESPFFEKSPFKDVLLVGLQHILGTTVDMFSVMREFGLEEAIIGGKNYSTHLESAGKLHELGFTYIPDKYQLGYGHFDDCMREVVYTIWFKAQEKLKEKKFRAMIILDDGADLLRATPGSLFYAGSTVEEINRPNTIIGIEQTRGGTNHPLFHGLPFPIINVAGSLAKTQIEYPFVAKIVSDKVLALIEEITPNLKKTPVIGVFGHGTMGKTIVASLTSHNLPVIVFEKNQEKRENVLPAIHYDNSAVLIANADIIVGCTGEDITALPENLSAFLYSKQAKWLISTGSKDHEFNSLLRLIQHEMKSLGCIPNPLENIRYENKVGASLNILRGGFPINFYNHKHSVPPEQIWPTRAALLLACLTAAQINRVVLKSKTNTIMLPPQVQMSIIKKYCSLNPNDEGLSYLAKLTDQEMLDLIINQSEGIQIDALNNNNK